MRALKARARATGLRFIVVCAQNPWKLNGGALIRNYWLIRALARRYAVDLVTADAGGDEPPAEFADACAGISRCPRPSGAALRRARLIGTLRPGGSYFTSGSVTWALRRRVRDLCARPGVVAMSDLQMRDALPHGQPFVYNAHNAEHELMRRRAEIEPAGPARALVRLDAARIGRLERGFVREATVVAACSENDRADLERLAPEARKKILIVPNGVELARYARVAATPAAERGTILLTGSFDWRPNRVGLDWFVAEVLPALRERCAAGAYRVRVAGRMDAALAAVLDALPNVRAVPNPDDMRAELARATLVAAPILASSGTRLRILEAWAAGRPVVTTTAGAFGLAYSDGSDLLVADAAGAFADALLRLLADAPAAARLAVGALERVQKYDWAVIGERFLDDSEPFLQPLGAA